jgi:hypothetical protein
VRRTPRSSRAPCASQSASPRSSIATTPRSTASSRGASGAASPTTSRRRRSPTNPNALLRWAYGLDISNGNSPKDAVVYLLFNHILRGNLLPPDLEAGIFRAMKQIPGVTLDTTVDVQGHPAYALGQTDDWLHQELLLDKDTYAYRGQRSTVVKDATIDPLKAGNSTGKVQKGHTVVAVRLAAGVVDRPGERP